MAVKAIQAVFLDISRTSVHENPDFPFPRALEDDLERRDFTVNALAYNDSEGLIDLHGGLEDLKNGIIRCIGDPDRRFNEDGLRILRALRFASQLGFVIEENTAKSIVKNFALLGNISAERISKELFGLLGSQGAAKTIKRLKTALTQRFSRFGNVTTSPNTDWRLL